MSVSIFDLLSEPGQGGDKLVLKIVPIKSQQTSVELFRAVQGHVRFPEDINVPTIAEWVDA